MDDEERIQDAYESLTSLKVIALQRQIQQKRKELDTVRFTNVLLLLCISDVCGRY